LPSVLRVITGHIDVSTAATTWTVGDEHKPVPVPQRRGAEVVRWAVDRRTHIGRIAEGLFEAGSLGDPDIYAALPSWAV